MKVYVIERWAGDTWVIHDVTSSEDTANQYEGEDFHVTEWEV